MKELELLKKDWKKQDDSFPKLSYKEIYKLIHKKSSSVVKWIFIISLIEFSFWMALNFLIPDSYLEIYNQFQLESFLYGSQLLHYAVLMVFIFLFYKNFKAISVTENTHLLMKNIIKTRKTVNYYVYYNIILYVVLSIVLNVVMFSQPEVLMQIMAPENPDIDGNTFLTVMFIVQIVTVFLICGLLWLYYRVIYGILLKKLNKNYKELESLDF
jgi:hypothetical protein